MTNQHLSNCAALFVCIGEENEICSVFSLLIPSLYEPWSQSSTICAPFHSTPFRAFGEETTFFSRSHRTSHGFWFSSYYQVDRRVLARFTFTTLTSSLTSVALRIVICSFPRQPTRTRVQRGFTDVEWKNMKHCSYQTALLFITLLQHYPEAPVK